MLLLPPSAGGNLAARPPVAAPSITEMTVLGRLLRSIGLAQSGSPLRAVSRYRNDVSQYRSLLLLRPH
jgi:hypothetical protein